MDTIKIHIDTNAEQASKSFEDLSKSFSDTDKQAIDLRKEIKGLKDELYKLTPGTEEYGRVLQELGGKMDQLSDTSQELRVATGGLDAVFQSTTNATATMAAGFTAATGVVALFGGDTENLQKTFVKLQAVMAITTGLKGFAAFGKETKKASTSLKAFINQMRLARTATQQQTTATATLTTTENVASTATRGLGAAFKSLTAAIASNPIGAILVALTAAVTAISHFTNKAKEAEEQTRRWNDVLNELKGSQYTYSSLLEQEQAYFDKDIAAMKALGASQESINKKTLEFSKTRREQLIADRDYLTHLVEMNKANKELNDKLEEWEAQAESCNAEIKELDNTIQTLSYNLPSFAKAFDDAMSDLDRNIAREITRGEITTKQGLEKRRKAYLDEIQKLNDAIYDYETQLGIRYDLDENGLPDLSEMNKSLSEQQKKDMENDIRDKKARVESYTQELKKIALLIEDENDRLIKSQSEAYKKLAEDHAKNAKKLNEDFEKDYDEIYKSVSEFDNKIQELFESFGFTDPANQGKMRSALQVMLKEIDKFAEDSRKKAEELVSTNQISYSAYASFINNLNEKVREMRDLANHYSKDIGLTDIAAVLNNNLKRDVKDLTSGLAYINQLYKDGLISREEYNNAYIDKVEGFKTIIASEQEDIKELYENLLNPEYLDEMVNTLEDGSEQTLREFLDSQKMTAEEYVEFLKNLFTQSGAILPPELAKSITDETVKIIDSQFKAIEARFKFSRSRFDIWFDDLNRSWLEGGTDTSYWGDSASTTYQKMQQQAEDLYKLLHQEYEQEMQLLEEKMKLLDENSEAYAQYYAKLIELRQADADAQAKYETDSLANTREYGQNVMEMTGKFTDSISGLASAMGSYYAEQAEQAKEMYGENSEEYKKYLKKEGNMKIAQVWTDAATGIMSAWATSEALGPIAGPILAAIQTATLLATAVASTQQIKRQTNANASGGSSTANVGQLTDRVIMADAQNTDQTAQLNAQYNQGNMRVYVTQNDIENANNENRVAVTSNKF